MMSQSLSELERYYKNTESILCIIDLVRMYCIGKRQGVITGTDSQSLEKDISSCLNKLPKHLELVESLPQSDALVVQYGSGVYSICGIHGASVHAAVIELARHLSLSLSQWKWLVNRRDASTELNRAKAVLKYENEKVKEKLVKLNQAGQPGGKSGEWASDDATKRLLNVYTNGLTDERFKKIRDILNNTNSSANDKLWKIDALMPIPPTISANQLGKALGVRKQAIQKTEWYIQKRKGEKNLEVERRHEQCRQRGQHYESSQNYDDD